MGSVYAPLQRQARALAERRSTGSVRKLVMFRAVEFGKEIELPTRTREKLLG